MNFPPLQCVSSQTFMAYKNETPSTQTTKLTNLEKPPSRKPSAKIRKVTQNVDEVKIIKVPRVTKEREDYMWTVSSSSYEGFFSSSDSSEEEGDEIAHTPIKLKRKAEQLQETTTMI